MSSDLRSRRPLKDVPPSAAESAGGAIGGAVAWAKSRPLRAPLLVKLRARQTLTPGHDRDGGYYVVTSGTVLLVSAPSSPRETITAVLYAGDVYQLPRAPEGFPQALVGATAAELWRGDSEALLADAATLGVTARYLADNLAHQLARQRLQMLALATLDGEERVASLLYDLACRYSQDGAQSVIFDMPLSRTDAASLLALNADTLSRIVSRIRSKGIISRTGRSRIACRNLAVLARQTPFAEAIRALQAGAPTYPADATS